jgi:predicted ATP-grasp superfamily ATP-dependent carboligase
LKVVVLEYITGGGSRAEAVSASLAREGELMLTALLDDLLDAPDIQPVVLRDTRFALPERFHDDDRIDWVGVATTDDFESVWKARLNACDAAWPVAPESGGILERLCQDVLDAGKLLLASAPATVRITASKAATLARLANHGIAVVPTYPLSARARELGLPWVLKPDQGAGCEGVRILRTRDDLETAQRELTGSCHIRQPLVEGQALSLSVLFREGRAQLLSGNRQYVEELDARLIFKGCMVNAFVDAYGSYQELANRIADALPELWGYAGIDLVLSRHGPKVLEINPRLTTSYAGLRRALGINPATAVLALLQERFPAPVDWRNTLAVEISLEAMNV